MNTQLQHLKIVPHYIHPPYLRALEKILGIFIYNK